MSEERPGVIGAEEWEAARRDPRMHELWAAADAYAEELVERGHCRCHLVINCPDRDGDGRADSESREETP